MATRKIKIGFGTSSEVDSDSDSDSELDSDLEVDSDSDSHLQTIPEPHSVFKPSTKPLNISSEFATSSFSPISSPFIQPVKSSTAECVSYLSQILVNQIYKVEETKKKRSMSKTTTPNTSTSNKGIPQMFQACQKRKLSESKESKGHVLGTTATDASSVIISPTLKKSCVIKNKPEETEEINWYDETSDNDDTFIKEWFEKKTDQKRRDRPEGVDDDDDDDEEFDITKYDDYMVGLKADKIRFRKMCVNQCKPHPNLFELRDSETTPWDYVCKKCKTDMYISLGSAPWDDEDEVYNPCEICNKYRPEEDDLFKN